MADLDSAPKCRVTRLRKPVILRSAFRRIDKMANFLKVQGRSPRMSKTKMRCITCGKWFQSANAKEVTCPDCTQKARKEKLALKNAPPVANKPGGTAEQVHKPAVPPPPKPKQVQSGTAHWLDTLQDVKVGEPDQPPSRPKPAPPASRDERGGYRPTSPAAYREDGTREEHERGNYEGGGRGPGAYREDRDRGPGGYRVGGGSGLPGTPPTFAPKPRQPMEGGFARGPHLDRPRPTGPREGGPVNQKPRGKGKPAGARKPSAPPKPKREKIPPPLPFVATLEQVTQVEERYIELSIPTEFDGIRTRIAQEIGIPKKAVKKIVKELRDRQDIPSWWELQTYKGSPEELESIKNAYLPLLPVPSVGVHKEIAEQLDLKAGVVYQAIKAIRMEMNLPQYNDPVLHGPDFVLHPKKKRHDPTEQPTEATIAETTEQPIEATTVEATEQPTEAIAAETTEQPTEATTEATEQPTEVIAAEPAEVVAIVEGEAVIKEVEATAPISEYTDTTPEAVPVTEGSVSSEA
jgi:hypothetical protein